MDLVTLLTGAGLFATGGALGRAIRPRRRKQASNSCAGCGHHLAHHADQGMGRCQVTNVLEEKRKEPILGPKRETLSDSLGQAKLQTVTVVVDKTQCSCQQYMSV